MNSKQQNKSDEINNINKNNYKCLTHNMKYISYCCQCNQNNCCLCENNHKNHKIIYFNNILLNLNQNNLKNILYDLKKYSPQFNNYIKDIINLLQNLIINLEKYLIQFEEKLNIFLNDIVNYKLLKNMNAFEHCNILKYIKEIIKDNDYIKDNNKNMQFDKIMKINNKLNNIFEILEEKDSNTNINESLNSSDEKLYCINLENYESYKRIFVIFTSIKDNKDYIILNRKEDLHLYLLYPQKYIKALKEHYFSVKIINYYINNKDNNEYLISGDGNKTVLIWDITHDYNIKYRINTYEYYNFNLAICLLLFPNYQSQNYIIIGEGRNDNKKGRRIYSFDNGDFIKELHDVDSNNIFYVLSWYNKKNDKYYLIQFLERKIQINDLLEGDLYSEFKTDLSIQYTYGYIYNKDDIDYLCSTTSFSKKDGYGYIFIWNLNSKNLFKIIKDKNGFSEIIQWNDRYSICIPSLREKDITFDDDNESFAIKIVDMNNYKIISNINLKNDVKHLQKMYHPIYGEVLLYLTQYNDIKLLNI